MRRIGSAAGPSDFARFWIGEAISDFGDQITLLAIPLTAVIVLGASPFEMGLLAAAGTLPTALLSLPAGVLVDRSSRRRILIVADVGRALALSTIPLTFVMGSLSLAQLYVVAFVTGTLSTFFIVAYQAYLPSLVQRAELVAANGRMNATASVAQLAGPSVAGVLVQLFTAPLPVVVDALSFLASVAGIAAVRRREPPPTPRVRNITVEVREGLVALLGHPVLRALVIGNSIVVFFFSAQLAIFLLYLSRGVRLEPSTIGILLAVGGIGALLGAVAAGPIARAIGVGPSFILAAVVAVLGFTGRGALAAPHELAIATIAIGQFAALFALSLFNVSTPSLRQALTPSHLLGRVNASYRFLVWGSGPLGALVGGTLAQGIGLQEAVLITGASTAFALPVYLASPLPQDAGARRAG